MHITVPVGAFLYLVAAKAVRKIAYDSGLLEGFVIDRDDAHAYRFEPLVEVHADRNALYLRRVFCEVFQVLLKFVEMRVGIDLIDIRAVIFKSL